LQAIIGRLHFPVQLAASDRSPIGDLSTISQQTKQYCSNIKAMCKISCCNTVAQYRSKVIVSTFFKGAAILLSMLQTNACVMLL